MDEVPLLLFLLVLSGFFSGAEIAFFSIGAEKIHAAKKNAPSQKELIRAERLELLKSNPNKLLVTILIGNNVVNVGSASLATVIATNAAQTSGAGLSEAMVLGMVTGVMTFMILLFGEITPKAIATRNAMKIALMITPVISFLQVLLFPLVWPLSKLVAKFSGGDKEVDNSLDEDEIKAALELSEKEGKIEGTEKEWVEKILEMGEHTVESIMTPRSKIRAFSDDTAIKEVLSKEDNFSRVPVFHDDLDNVIGILNVHAILEKVSEKDFFNLRLANFRLTSPMKVPITKKIDILLQDFQLERSHMALIYDEHGGMVGLITMEDVLEEIFGEIQDEQDEEENFLRQNGKHSIEMDASIELEQIEDFVHENMNMGEMAFPWKLEDENKTIGLLILESLEAFPEEGETCQLETHDYTFTITVKQCDEEKIELINFEFEEK